MEKRQLHLCLLSGSVGRSLSEFYTDLDVKINFVLACVSLPIDISRLFLYSLGISRSLKQALRSYIS